MTNPHGPKDPARERRFLEDLRPHPQLLERFEAILALTKSDQGELRTADEVEELLIQEVRRLGHRTMHDWAQGAGERAARDWLCGVAQWANPSRARGSEKKRLERVVRVWLGARPGADLARSGAWLSAPFPGGGQSERARQIPAAPARAV